MLTGLDRLVAGDAPPHVRGRVGLLCNATTTTAAHIGSADAVASVAGLTLARIFSPQHGFLAEKQDNMIASADAVHPRLGVPIVSLYGEVREPAPDAFADLDWILIDLQDVGTRVYTFLVTALYVMRAAAAAQVPVLVLDRPNPIGGASEGPMLTEGFASFVGITDVPLRHGLTPGEFCRYGAWRLKLGDVEVLALDGWQRRAYFDQTDLPWSAPSPNMPTLATALVYPGQVLLEGTTLSEGRGTTRPFEVLGSPTLDPDAVVRALADAGYLAKHVGDAIWGRGGTPLAGLLLRETAFEPMFQKHAGRLCRGFELRVLERAFYRPVDATLALLWAIRRVDPDHCTFRAEPYEYERDRLAFDLICGTDAVRTGLEQNLEPMQIAARWPEACEKFQTRARPFLLY